MEREETAAMLIGRATHCRILEGCDAYESQFALGGPINPKYDKPFGKDTKAFSEWAKAQGKPGIHYDDLDLIENLASGLSMNSLAVDLLLVWSIRRCHSHGLLWACMPGEIGLGSSAHGYR